MKTSERSLFQKIYVSLTKQSQCDISKIAGGQLSLSLPVISSQDLITLCKYVENIFKSESILLKIEPPLIIIGDLHGHFLDLLRIIQVFGLPINRKFLFLGDLVDRGDFSIETVTLVFALKALYPDNVFIIRGNHEFDFLCNRCGFSQEIVNVYNDPELYDAFLAAFNQMPLACLISKKILCVHGGIGPTFTNVSQLTQLKRPIPDFNEGLLDTILWSDPVDTTQGFEPSQRGTGYYFGQKALIDFLESNKLDLLIRAHECIMDGCQYKFNNRLITVFGASNYCGLVQNFSACIHINKNMEIQFHQFPPLNYLKRSDVIFVPDETQTKKRRFDSCFSSTQALIMAPPQLVQHPKPLQPKTQSTRSSHLSRSANYQNMRQSTSKIAMSGRRTSSSLLFQ